ncbi:helix-turn-helix domain-containing protein [Paenibacillus vandeheii]
MKGIDHKSKFLLTHREREVFELLVQDKTTRDIAGQLFISEKTVRNHISNVMQFEIVYKIGRINGWNRVEVESMFVYVV